MNGRRLRVALALAGCIVVTGCKENVAAPEPLRPVLSTVIKGAAPENAVIVGTVQPQFKADLGFRVLGRLIARPVSVGDMVQDGEVVAAIDPAALELAVRASEANLSSSQAQLINATGVEARQRALNESSVTTKASLEAAEQSRAATQAAVVRAQANLTKAREQLGYAQLKSDFAGVVTAVGAEVGQVVSPGQGVVTVARPDIREAVIDVSDEVAATLRIGMPFTVRLQLAPDIEANGKIREIAPQADAITRTRRVRITLDNPPATFRLGATITTSLPVRREPVIRLPASAILTKEGKTFVWLVDTLGNNHVAKLREVQASGDDKHGYVVTSGLKVGMRVATAGVHSLVEGQKVRLDQEAQL